MAYKNKNKNKIHIEKLNKDRENWRNVKRRNSRIIIARNNLREYGLDKETIEKLLHQQGLI